MVLKAGFPMGRPCIAKYLASQPSALTIAVYSSVDAAQIGVISDDTKRLQRRPNTHAIKRKRLNLGRLLGGPGGPSSETRLNGGGGSL